MKRLYFDKNPKAIKGETGKMSLISNLDYSEKEGLLPNKMGSKYS